MAKNFLSSIAPLQLHLTPPPRNITESRAILHALEQFGQIIMFKVLRFEETTKELTPRAHIIFKSTASANKLLAASKVHVPSTGITIIPSESIFKHPQYIEYASARHYIKDQSLLSRRRKGPVEQLDVEEEDTTIRFGSDGSLTPSTQLQDMRSRLLGRYVGDFIGIIHLERLIALEKKRKQALERQVKKKAELSGESEEALHEDQSNTTQGIIGDVGDEEKGRKSATE